MKSYQRFIWSIFIITIFIILSGISAAHTVPGSNNSEKECSKEIGLSEEDLEQMGIQFVEYDVAPVPEGGYNAVADHLEYPESAREAGVEGRVIVLAHIDTDGTILDTKVGQSVNFKECDNAALTAIKAVKWTPAKKDNKPIAAWIMVPIAFQLQGCLESSSSKE